jgi:hypothetical protein
MGDYSNQSLQMSERGRDGGWPLRSWSVADKKQVPRLRFPALAAPEMLARNDNFLRRQAAGYPKKAKR